MTEEEIQAERDRFHAWFKDSDRYPRITRLMASGIDPDDPDTGTSASSSAWTASSTASPPASAPGFIDILPRLKAGGFQLLRRWESR